MTDEREPYSWCVVFPDGAYIPGNPPCGMGPKVVMARSTREAARKFWKAFSDQVFKQTSAPISSLLR